MSFLGAVRAYFVSLNSPEKIDRTVIMMSRAGEDGGGVSVVPTWGHWGGVLVLWVVGSSYPLGGTRRTGNQLVNTGF